MRCRTRIFQFCLSGHSNPDNLPATASATQEDKSASRPISRVS